MYERINLRVDKMLENGLIDEVKSLTGISKTCSATNSRLHRNF